MCNEYRISGGKKIFRFLQPSRFSVATIFSQISFIPSPVLVFKEVDTGGLQLVATGNLASVDPDRFYLLLLLAFVKMSFGNYFLRLPELF